MAPNEAPSEAPSVAPSVAPSETPSVASSETPSEAPSEAPSVALSEAPSVALGETPSLAPIAGSEVSPTGEAVSLSGETAQPGVVVALGEPSNVNDLLTSAGVQGDIKSLVEDLGEPGLGGLLSPLSN